jgi:hypothetical protein
MGSLDSLLVILILVIPNAARNLESYSNGFVSFRQLAVTFGANATAIAQIFQHYSDS